LALKATCPAGTLASPVSFTPSSTSSPVMFKVTPHDSNCNSHVSGGSTSTSMMKCRTAAAGELGACPETCYGPGVITRCTTCPTAAACMHHHKHTKQPSQHKGKA
jgi:hypothetical protein